MRKERKIGISKNIYEISDIITTMSSENTHGDSAINQRIEQKIKHIKNGNI